MRKPRCMLQASTERDSSLSLTPVNGLTLFDSRTRNIGKCVVKRRTAEARREKLEQYSKQISVRPKVFHICCILVALALSRCRVQ